MNGPIICGLDGSEHARLAGLFACDLARALRTSLNLVHVIEAPAADRLPALNGIAAGVPPAAGVQLRVRTGDPAAVLSQPAPAGSLVIVGARGQGAARRAPLGRVASRLVARPPCPVAGTAAPAGARSVLCGVRDERDIASAQVAARLASALRLRLTLVHVAHGPPEDRGVTYEWGRRLLERVARPLTATLGCDVETHVVEGSPGPQLERIAAASDAALIALGTAKRRPFDAALGRAASRHLIAHGTRPVLCCPGGA